MNDIAAIEGWIKNVESERNSLFTKITNRIAVPTMLFKSTDYWLKILNFTRKQEIEKEKFFEKLRTEVTV